MISLNGKVDGYEGNLDEPYATIYEQWLYELYGHSAMRYFWNHTFFRDELQTLLAIGGFFHDECDHVNTAISPVWEAERSGSANFHGYTYNRYETGE